MGAGGNKMFRDSHVPLLAVRHVHVCALGRKTNRRSGCLLFVNTAELEGRTTVFVFLAGAVPLCTLVKTC